MDKGHLVEVGPIGDILRAYGRSLDEGLALDHNVKGAALLDVRATTRNSIGDVTSTFGVGDSMRLQLVFAGPPSVYQPRSLFRITSGEREDLIEASSVGWRPAPTARRGPSRPPSIPCHSTPACTSSGAASPPAHRRSVPWGGRRSGPLRVRPPADWRCPPGGSTASITLLGVRTKWWLGS